MNDRKPLYIANFNLTFGKENLPMLEQFENVILPAFQSKIVREYRGDKFHFENVELKMAKGEFVLAGIIVRRTTLEVKSEYNEESGTHLTNQKIKSAPFSYFLISLKNHRMVLVKNQKGSPTTANFSTTARSVLKEYIRLKNTDIQDNKLPQPNLNVVEIPFKNEIEKEINKVEKIKKITLRFYPLNGDIDNSEVFAHLRELLENVDSKSGNTQINTPKDKQGVIELLTDTKGTVKPVLDVVYPNNVSRKLRDDSFSEKIEIILDEESSFTENIDKIMGNVTNKKEFTETSNENKSIYDRFFSKIFNIFDS